MINNIHQWWLQYLFYIIYDNVIDQWYTDILVGGIPTPLNKYISQLGWLFPIYGKNNPNHQPVLIVEVFENDYSIISRIPVVTLYLYSNII